MTQLSLKIGPAAADSPGVIPGIAAPVARRPAAERGMRALVVDDQASARALLSRILRADLGCTVVEATQGAEALHLLGRQPFDVMILDVVMPVMDGIATLEAVRRHPDYRSLPVIVLSAVRDEARVRQLVQLGVAAYLVKPLRPLDVADRLKHLVARVERTAPGPRVSLPDPRAAELRPQMIGATEQVFGMMLGLEVQAVGQGMAARPGDDAVSLRLRLDDEASDLTFTLAAPRAITERMTAQYLQGGDVVADADVEATLRELGSVIGSRIQTALRQRGDRVTLGAAEVTRVAAVADDDLEQTGICVAFASATQDLRFTTRLRVVPAARVTYDRQLQAGPVSRTLTMDMSTLPPPVDTEVLDMLASLQEPGEPDLLAELVSLFLRDTPERLRDLAQRPLQPAPVARIAHTVKGSAGNLGASHLQELASQLEQAGQRDSGSEELATLADAVCAEFTRVASYLEAVLSSRADADPTAH